MRRSFWFALALAATLWATVATLAGVLVATVAPCVTHLIPMPARPVCIPHAWPAVWIPWLALGTATIAAAGCLVAAARSIHRQMARTRTTVAAIVAAEVTTPSRARSAAEAVGIRRLAVVDISRPVAITRGFLRTAVVVSTGLLERVDDEELCAILAHEAEHARMRDPLRVFCVRAAAVAMWPFPVVRDLTFHAELGTEIAADRAAQARCGLGPLVRGLDVVLAGMTEVDDAAVNSIGGLRQRLEFLESGRPPTLRLQPTRLRLSLLSSAVIVVVAGALGLAVIRVGALS